MADLGRLEYVEIDYRKPQLITYYHNLNKISVFLFFKERRWEV